MTDPYVVAVVPAGGAGTRLWPLSRAGRPKFLHDLTGAGRTLLQGTWDRLVPIVDEVVVVTGARHAEAVAEQLPALPAAALLSEPSPRDSMAAIGLAAAVLSRREPDRDLVLGSFAADHVIADETAFARAVASAVEIALTDRVVTIGIEADHPSTAFGYIELGERLPDSEGFAVSAFTEKPDAETAAAYLSTGRYRWNAGMYVMRATVLLAHLRRFQPMLSEGVERIAAAWDTDERAAVLAQVWPTLTKIAIDHAISEPLAAEGGIAVVPASFGWDDVGDWRSLAALLPAAAGQSRVLGEASSVLALDAPGLLAVPASGRQVVAIGIPDAVVIDTDDAVLVTTAEHAQLVKRAVDELRESGRADLL